MQGMDRLRRLRASRLLPALLLVALAAGELFDGHAEPLRPGLARVHSHAVEAAATHADAAAHLDAAGARDTARCPLCTLRAHGGSLAAPSPSSLAPAAGIALAVVAVDRLPGGRDARGASRGRAPPLA